MARKQLDKLKLQTEILTYLSRAGATPAQALCQTFNISQSTLSRILAAAKDNLVVVGSARETKYAVKRNISGVSTPIPIYEILENGSTRHLGLLHALQPQGFYFESQLEDAES